MKKITKIATYSALVGAALTSAHANSINIQLHRPGSSWHYTVLENAADEYQGFEDYKTRFTLYGGFNYAKNPMTVTDMQRTERLGELVDGMSTIDLMAQVDFKSGLAINAAIPINFVQPTGSTTESAAGDIRLFAKYYFNRGYDGINWAIVPEITLPTGNKDLYMSDDSVGLGASLAAEKDFGTWSLVGNVGYRAASNATFSVIDYRSRIPVSAGAYVPFTPAWAGSVEARKDITFGADKFENPSELYGLLRHEFNPTTMAYGGLGFGSFGGATSVDYRIILGLKLRFLGAKNETLQATNTDVITTPVAAAEPAPAPAPLAVFTPKEIKIATEVRFLEDSDVLTPKGQELLNEVAQVIIDNRGSFKRISIQGHTNVVGPGNYNMGLSKRRTITVMNYLKSRGVKAKELSIAYFGKTRPKPGTKNLSIERQRIVNRRVEFKVLQ